MGFGEHVLASMFHIVDLIGVRGWVISSEMFNGKYFKRGENPGGREGVGSDRVMRHSFVWIDLNIVIDFSGRRPVGTKTVVREGGFGLNKL